MASATDLRKAEEIRDTILREAGDAVERIVFHGSRARGKARPNSDYDILVVMSDPVRNWLDESMRLSDLFVEFERPVDVQVFGHTEFEESKPVPATICYPADQHGVVLYEKPRAGS
jgi:predicted nucleotidyltransferase